MVVDASAEADIEVAGPAAALPVGRKVEGKKAVGCRPT